MSWLIWAIMLISMAIVATMPRESGIRTLVASIILRFIFSFGPEPTLWLLGSVTVVLKGVPYRQPDGKSRDVGETFSENNLRHTVAVPLLLHDVLPVRNIGPSVLLLSFVVRRCLSRGDSIECHSFGNS
ncbi:hypothetical protein HA402_007393 [Bradysia odoriphaga]|nr:hypothetical protein HA402_007393 [Bradysia odoriphaga]